MLKISAALMATGPVMASALTSLVSFRPLKKTALSIRRFDILCEPGHKKWYFVISCYWPETPPFLNFSKLANRPTWFRICDRKVIRVTCESPGL